jgi:hypothetical protein
MEKRFFTAKQITGIAVLLALVIVLQAALGSISIGAVFGIVSSLFQTRALSLSKFWCATDEIGKISIPFFMCL